MAAVKKPKKPKTPKPPKPTMVAATAALPSTAEKPIALPFPVIVIHGGPASNLWDLYLTRPDPIYTLTRGSLFGIPKAEKHHERLPFHPDDRLVTLNTSGRAVAPARISALSAFYLPYEDLVEQLKKDLGSIDVPAPVFPFAYDWRLDTVDIAPLLDAFIAEVLNISSYLPHYKKNPPKQVDIVAHSYGGLVTARYLGWMLKNKKERPVRKVVTMGSPFRGAVNAVFTMIKDLDQREAARTLPAVYDLIPYFPSAVVDLTKGAPPPDVDLLTDPKIWKGSSVERSLETYCRRLDSAKTGAQRLDELRAVADQQRKDFANLDVKAALGLADNWLPIVGTSAKTNTQVRIVNVQPDPKPPDPEFAFHIDPAGGDNTVPFLGAIPAFDLETGAPNKETPVERLVCFTEDDIGLHERADLLGLGQAFGLVSLHSFLPQMDAVQQVIFSFLRTQPPRIKARARPAPGIPAANVRWPEAWNVVPR